MTETIRHLDVWRGEYRGITFEINKFKSYIPESHEHSWTFYLFIYLDRIPKDFNPDSFWLPPNKDGISKRTHYEYHTHPIISNIEFHCGCTWYSKESGHDGNPRVIKIGCDYQHLWDDGHIYTPEIVLMDVKKAIDSFHDLVPGYKFWCSGNGNLYLPSEGEMKGNNFYSFDYINSSKD